MEAQMEHYLDNSATTQVLRPVAEKALELMVQEYGNPSSLHTKGFQARKQLEEARTLVARRRGAPPAEGGFYPGRPAYKRLPSRFFPPPPARRSQDSPKDSDSIPKNAAP